MTVRAISVNGNLIPLLNWRTYQKKSNAFIFDYDYSMGRGQRVTASTARPSWPLHYEPRPIDREAAKKYVEAAIKKLDHRISVWESSIRIFETRKAHTGEEDIDGTVGVLNKAIAEARRDKDGLSSYDTETLDLDGLEKAVDSSRKITRETSVFKLNSISNALREL
jgi:hypothetical protein